MPGRALDPFCGTGTTAAVAKRLGRNYITIDREGDYIEVAEKCLANIAPALRTSSDEAGVLLGGPKPRIPFVSFIESGVLPAGTPLRLKGTSLSPASTRMEPSRRAPIAAPSTKFRRFF